MKPVLLSVSRNMQRQHRYLDRALERLGVITGIREYDRAGEIERNRFVRERSFFAIEINRHQDTLTKFPVPPDAADERPLRFEAGSAVWEDFGYDPGKSGDAAFPVARNEFEDQLVR